MPPGLPPGIASRVLAACYAGLAARPTTVRAPALDGATVRSAYRTLTAAQREALSAMPPFRPFNALRATPRRQSLRRLDELGLVVRGRHGWLDARLTELGRSVRKAAPPVRHA